VCSLCGTAHYGIARTCPHIRSEHMVRLMIDALRYSPERREYVDVALKYLKGVKGHLVAAKKKAVGQGAVPRGGPPPAAADMRVGPPVHTQAPSKQTATPANHPSSGFVTSKSHQMHRTPNQPHPGASSQAPVYSGFTPANQHWSPSKILGESTKPAVNPLKAPETVEDRLLAAFQKRSF
jgi:hypothetical protein